MRYFKASDGKITVFAAAQPPCDDYSWAHIADEWHFNFGYEAHHSPSVAIRSVEITEAEYAALRAAMLAHADSEGRDPKSLRRKSNGWLRNENLPREGT